MSEALSFIAIIVTGLLVGTELSIAAFVHPALSRLPDKVHQPAASALARVLGKVMPIWYPLVFVLLLAQTIVAWRYSGQIPIWFTTAAILWMLATIFSLTSLVPINTRIASWENSPLPPDWKTHRKLWDSRHRWRVVLLAAAFAFLIFGTLSH